MQRGLLWEGTLTLSPPCPPGRDTGQSVPCRVQGCPGAKPRWSLQGCTRGTTRTGTSLLCCPPPASPPAPRGRMLLRQQARKAGRAPVPQVPRNAAIRAEKQLPPPPPTHLRCTTTRIGFNLSTTRVFSIKGPPSAAPRSAWAIPSPHLPSPRSLPALTPGVRGFLPRAPIPGSVFLGLRELQTL